MLFVSIMSIGLSKRIKIMETMVPNESKERGTIITAAAEVTSVQYYEKRPAAVRYV